RLAQRMAPGAAGPAAQFVLPPGQLGQPRRRFGTGPGRVVELLQQREPGCGPGPQRGCDEGLGDPPLRPAPAPLVEEAVERLLAHRTRSTAATGQAAGSSSRSGASTIVSPCQATGSSSSGR